MGEFNEGDLIVILKGEYLGNIVGSEAHLKAHPGGGGDWLAVLTPEAQEAYAEAANARWSSPEAKEADRLEGWPVSNEYIRKVGS